MGVTPVVNALRLRTDLDYPQAGMQGLPHGRQAESHLRVSDFIDLWRGVKGLGARTLAGGFGRPDHQHKALLRTNLLVIPCIVHGTRRARESLAGSSPRQAFAF